MIDFLLENLLEIWVDFAFCHTEDFWEEIGEAIEKSNVVLFLMTKEYQDSKSCRQEVMYAKDSLKKRFIPIYAKKDFVATGWLGVRIVGPQYIRFGKKAFDDTIKELIKLIIEDPERKESEKQKSPVSPAEIKPIETQQTSKPEKDDDSSEHDKIPLSNRKPIEQWTSKEIAQWFDENNISHELHDIYNFRNGTELLLYGKCLRSDWQVEYLDMRDRYSKNMI